MKRIIITGNRAEAIYDDALLPLFKALGIVDIQRATNVEFDNDKLKWVATFIETGEVIAIADRREVALQQEVEWIQRRIDESHRKS